MVSERDVRRNFDSEGQIHIYSKTPSIGGSWSTHPSLKYTSDNDVILGKPSVFAKVSTEQNILVEKENLIKMRDQVSVPEVLDIYKNEEEDLFEIHEMKPGYQIAAILVEEFIDSISLGQAVLEERLNIDLIVDGVLNILKDMHKFCAHRDLKHSHIRIDLDARTAENLTRGMREELDLDIEGFSIIDVETTKMKREFSDGEFEDNVVTDITQLLASLNGYMSTLEHDTEVIKRVFPTPLAVRLKRFGTLLDALSDEYTIRLPKHFLTESKTTRFLKMKLGT
ncbi:MAG: hypothetical protein JSV09_04980 [Thermoplasmata archaeon]|nr:MAG: hypothetical protein JSV09_04980 [Thermoplasmata archaeon]